MKQGGNEAINYLREKAKKDFELQKSENNIKLIYGEHLEFLQKTTFSYLLKLYMEY